MWGEGRRRTCPECGQSVTHIADSLSHRELRGPRNITSSNVDRIFDDGGQRFLIIEEKKPNERVSHGQRQMLTALSRIPSVDVWLARGTTERIDLSDVADGNPWPFLQGINFDGYQKAVANWFERLRRAV